MPVPVSAANQVSNVVDSLTTETLLATEFDGKASPRLATSWEWNDTHTELRLHLRKNVVFHDGSPLTSDVVAESLRRGVKAQDALSFSSIASVSTGPQDSVDIHLSAPDSFLLTDLGNTSVTLPGHPGVGTGPYHVTQNGPNIELEAFRQYYRGQPELGHVTISSYPTQRSAWAAMMRSDVDALYEVSRDAVDFVKAESAVKVYEYPRAYYYLLAFNQRNPVLKNAAVRRALNSAVDKQAIVRDGMRGQGRPATGPVWPDFWALESTKETTQFNPDAAKSELDAAGFPVRHTGAEAMDRRFQIRCLVWADDSRLERIALLLQRQLFDVGVDLQLEPVTLRTMLARASKGDFDTFLFEMVSGRTLSWVYTFWHSPAEQNYNFTGYRAADEVLDGIRRATSDDVIRTGVADLNRVLHDDPPAVFLAWQTQARAVSSKFEVPAEPRRDIMSSVWLWKPAPAGQVAER